LGLIPGLNNIQSVGSTPILRKGIKNGDIDVIRKSMSNLPKFGDSQVLPSKGGVMANLSNSQFNQNLHNGAGYRSTYGSDALTLRGDHNPITNPLPINQQNPILNKQFRSGNHRQSRSLFSKAAESIVL
jgi:hypothetical protein